MASDSQAPVKSLGTAALGGCTEGFYYDLKLQGSLSERASEGVPVSVQRPVFIKTEKGRSEEGFHSGAQLQIAL